MLAGPWSEKSVYKYSFLPEGPKKLFSETASPLSRDLDEMKNKLTDNRKRAKILADNRKRHHPIETLL